LSYRKIINDPVYGFITIENELIYKVISHRYYQRLRRIHQMALAQLVYPGAVHSRLQHSLGAYHLMGNAINELRGKGFEITAKEDEAVKIAILLHDIGHGPYSHALEGVLIENASHEHVSFLMMKKMNEEMNGELQMAIDIFTDAYSKKFLHQLVSGQLDVDRMDYIMRDSFYSGVNEGTIGYDRILKMLTIHNGELMIEEKGIYSTEKFLVSRRLMYWQVYLHKTVLVAEKMLVNIIVRAREVGAKAPTAVLNNFLTGAYKHKGIEHSLEEFCCLDDYDVLIAIKEWTTHPDKVLSFLCKGIVNRELLKIKYSAQPPSDQELTQERDKAAKELGINGKDLDYIVFSGFSENRTYNSKDEHINILYKDGTVKDISHVDNALINQTLYGTVKKFYLCYPKQDL
jgi:uncharacterized protein